MQRNIILSVFVAVYIAFIGLTASQASPSLQSNSTFTYYLDCQVGSDLNTGKSEGSPWATLDKINATILNPGDQVLLQRGCVFEGRLVLPWHGTQSSKILIGAYGTGDNPIIQNKATDIENDNHHVNVRLSGSHMVVENITTRIVNPYTDPSCQNQTRGYYVGFAFTHTEDSPQSGHSNIIRNVEAYEHTIGAFLGPGSENNLITHSHFHDNNVMQLHTMSTNDQLGAWGILVNGDNNEIANNTIENNQAWCSFDVDTPSNSIELFASSNNLIHHNTSINDRVFSELGSDNGKIAQNNMFAFNLVISDVDQARFIVSRGTGHQFGPVKKTRVFNNTVFYTSPTGQGIVCGSNCDSEILIARNNILWAEEKAIFASGEISEENNIFWSTDGDPLVQLEGGPMNSSSMIANPLFANVSNSDFQLTANSPAIDSGKNLSWIVGQGIPFTQSGNDWGIGRFEFGSPTGPIGTPTPAPTSTPTPNNGSTHVVDSFSRTTSQTWGTAETGGAYSYFFGLTAADQFSTNGSEGILELTPGNQSREVVLEDVSALDSTMTIDFSLNKMPSNQFDIRLLGRHIDTGTMYRGALRIKNNGQVELFFDRLLNNQWSKIGNNVPVGNLVLEPNVKYQAMFEVKGTNPAQLSLKIWRKDLVEPANWQLTVTDATAALQQAGSAGLKFKTTFDTNSEPIEIHIDNFSVTNVDVGQPTPTPTPSSGTLANDNFNRTSAAGWGNAPEGGPYLYVGGAPSENYFSVNGTTGVAWLNNASEKPELYLTNPDALHSTSIFKLEVDKEPTNWHELRYMVRRVDTFTTYRLLIRLHPSGQVKAKAIKIVDGDWISLSNRIRIPNVNFTAGDPLWVKISADGTNPTSLRVKVWNSGDAEPTDWQFSATDSEPALQGYGDVGFQFATSTNSSTFPVQFLIDDFSVSVP